VSQQIQVDSERLAFQDIFWVVSFQTLHFNVLACQGSYCVDASPLEPGSVSSRASKCNLIIPNRWNNAFTAWTRPQSWYSMFSNQVPCRVFCPKSLLLQTAEQLLRPAKTRNSMQTRRYEQSGNTVVALKLNNTNPWYFATPNNLSPDQWYAMQNLQAGQNVTLTTTTGPNNQLYVVNLQLNG